MYTLDTWAINSSGCGSITEVNSSNPVENFGKESCLVIPDWSESAVATRYAGLICDPVSEWDTVANAISSYQSRFQSYMQSVDTVFGDIEADFNLFAESLTSTGVKTYDLYQSTLYYIDVELDPIIFTISDPRYGLIHNLNCNFTRQIYDDIELSICDNFLPNLFQLFISLLVMSILSLVHMFISMSLNNKLRSAPSPS